MSPIQQPRFRFHTFLFKMFRIFLGWPAKDDPCHDAIQETERNERQGIVLLRPDKDGFQPRNDLFGCLDVGADGSKGHSAKSAMRSVVLSFEHLRKRGCLRVIVKERKELASPLGLCLGSSGNEWCTGDDSLLEKHLLLLGNMTKYTMSSR